MLGNVVLQTSCAHRASLNNETPDEALFSLVIEQFIAERHGQLRVDPRPLKPDPNLLTLEYSIAEIAPSRVTAEGSALLKVDSAFLQRRIRTLAKYGLRTGDALKRSGCPGHMVPPTPEVLQKKRELCPQGDPYTIAIFAVPRAGQDTTVEYEPREANLPAWSVRAIIQDEGSTGWTSYGVDYVFVRESRWRFLKEKVLFVIE
ncbi:MAG TPA: hypothetical protein VGD49_11925 [Longimicrobiales bacterium]